VGRNIIMVQAMQTDTLVVGLARHTQNIGQLEQQVDTM